jgi:hypothetical protein
MKRILSGLFVIAMAFTMISGCACGQKAAVADTGATDRCGQLVEQCASSARAAEAAAQRAEAAARRAEAAADRAEKMFMKGMKK